MKNEKRKKKGRNWECKGPKWAYKSDLRVLGRYMFVNFSAIYIIACNIPKHVSKKH